MKFREGCEPRIHRGAKALIAITAVACAKPLGGSQWKCQGLIAIELSVLFPGYSPDISIAIGHI